MPAGAAIYHLMRASEAPVLTTGLCQGGVAALCSLDVLLSVMMLGVRGEQRGESPASRPSQGSIITIGTGPGVTAPAPTIARYPHSSLHTKHNTYRISANMSQARGGRVRCKSVVCKTNLQTMMVIKETLATMVWANKSTIKCLNWINTQTLTLPLEEAALQTWTHTITKMPHNRRL